MNVRVLAVDPGEKRIGLAISDESGMYARPLSILKHVSRLVDAAEITRIATENEAGLILVGQALDSENQVTPQGRKSSRLAEAIQEQTQIHVKLWDEGGSTRRARSIKLEAGTSKSKRSGHLDNVAAAVILQDYLDTKESHK